MVGLRRTARAIGDDRSSGVEGRNSPKPACPKITVFGAGYGLFAIQSPDLAAHLRDVAKSLLLRDEHGQIDGLGHGLITCVVWMQVVATIVGGVDVFRIFGVLEQFVEVD